MRKAPLPATPGRKPQDYAQARRVAQLYRVLLDGGSIRMAEAESAYGVSHRTLQRDVALLHDLEPGLHNDQGPSEPAVYELPRDRLKGKVRQEQLLALMLGAEQISFLTGRDFVTQVRPLLDLLANGLGRTNRERLNRLERKVIVLEPARRRYRERPELQARLATVLDGLVREVALDVRYLSPARRGRGDGARSLQVQPLALALHRQGVYVVVEIIAGEWPTVPQRILLALDRIEAVQPSEPAQPFRPPEDFDPQSWFAPAFGIVRDRSPGTVALHVDATWAPYVLERSWHASERLIPRENGGLRLELDVGDWREVVDYVLAMGEHVEVIAPPEMRAEVAGRLQRAAGLYASIQG
jgi:predicted DNA-binding transcriptional regulator YafY